MLGGVTMDRGSATMLRSTPQLPSHGQPWGPVRDPTTADYNTDSDIAWSPAKKLMKLMTRRRSEEDADGEKACLTNRRVGTGELSSPAPLGLTTPSGGDKCSHKLSQRTLIQFVVMDVPLEPEK
ncbi:hypothetical protein CORC01_05863 [Colletotrichum orchidophilum]|uniref:Uncharacterized protein n=1 Tax=Colletotrichum orchidophilum TaxID=1209926 RepID=A0A1G4BBJ6_9PEZI|nr:uncharacterized protein CORC01_05863 [Colletotrichum orchidophilum]OHE98774.1 hypothetical protein CORC01_05863 [Colletotrichum orchidophilum]